MSELIMHNIVWWITVIEIPALAGLLALCLKLRDAQASDRLDAMRSYAPMRDVRDLEKRLVSHLLRIEAKLDVTALKAERLVP